MSTKIACQLKGEYAKVVRYRTNNRSKGLQVAMTLPSAKDFGGTSGFINFYLGFGNWEVGISTKPKNDGANPEEKWHWFVNSTHGEAVWDAPWEFDDGEQIFLKAWFDNQGYMNFQVNNKVVFKSNHRHTGSVTNTRLVVASAQATSTSVPWKYFHNQVVLRDMMYRDSNNQWVPITSSNGYIDYFNCGDDTKSYTFTELTYTGKYAYASLK